MAGVNQYDPAFAVSTASLRARSPLPHGPPPPSSKGLDDLSHLLHRDAGKPYVTICTRVPCTLGQVDGLHSGRFPGGSDDKEFACNEGDLGSGKSPGEGKGWLPTPVFWPGELHGLYSPWGRKELDTTECLSLHFTEQYKEDTREEYASTWSSG